MVENFLLEYDKASSYALVKLIDAEHMPYVVAYGYDTENRDWSQGHYYSKIEEAVAAYREATDKGGMVAYAIDTPAGRIGVFDGDESEDYHGIRICWLDENDAVIDLIAMVEGESVNHLECNSPAFVTYGYRADSEEPIPVPFFVKPTAVKSE